MKEQIVRELTDIPIEPSYLFIFDIDGVLTMPKIFELMINQLKQNTPIIINTLRPFDAKTELMETLRKLLCSYPNAMRAMIVERGAVMVVNGGKERICLVRDKELLNEKKENIARYLKQIGKNVSDVAQGTFRFNYNDQTLKYSARPGLTVGYIIEESNQPGYLTSLCSKLNSLFQEDLIAIQETHENSLIVTDPMCTKGYALAVAFMIDGKLRNKEVSRSVCFGDGRLDEDMFQTVQKYNGITINTGPVPLQHSNFWLRN